jgi:hypothetical protein
MRHRFICALIEGILLIFLSACGGGGGGTSTSNPPTQQVDTLSGVAAAGAPIIGATVTLKDKYGLSKTTVTNGDGTYSFDITNLSAPFLLQIPYGATHLYSVAAAAGTANIHPFTDLIIRNWYEVHGDNVDTVFGGTGPLTATPPAADITSIESVVRNILSTWMTQVGLNPSAFDLITTPFTTSGTGFDEILDQTKVNIDVTGQVTITETDPETGLSAKMMSVAITDLTSTDSTVPTDLTGVSVMAATPNSILLVWNAPTDNISVAGYHIYRGNTLVGTTALPVFTDSGLAASTPYCYQVQAFDEVGNTSNKSAQACTTTLAIADTTAPTVPNGLTGTATSPSQISLTWNVATDDTTVVGYQIMRDGKRIATVTTPAYSDSGLSANTNYCYTVEAFDSAMNVSGASMQVCTTTSAESAPVNTLWRTTIPGSKVYSTESPAGPTTRFDTLLLSQSGIDLSGEFCTQDTMGASATKAMVGGINGNAISLQYQDPDPACAGRTASLTGTMGTSSMLLTYSASAAGSCAAVSDGPHLYTAFAPILYTAGGTYSFDSSTQTLSLNWTNYSLPGVGPPLGPEDETGVTASATTLAGTNGFLTVYFAWTRANGTANDITGTWTSVDPGGDRFQLTFDADGSFNLTVLGASDGTLAVVSTHNTNGVYYMGAEWYYDPTQIFSSGSVSGPYITSSLSLTYYTYDKVWRNEGSTVTFGATHPTPPLTYTVTMSNSTMQTTSSDSVGCFVEDLATGLSVTSDSFGNPVFHWSNVPYPQMRYDVEMYNAAQQLYLTVSAAGVDITSADYTGPPLSPGTYQYLVHANSLSTLSCASFAEGNFTYPVP